MVFAYFSKIFFKAWIVFLAIVLIVMSTDVAQAMKRLLEQTDDITSEPVVKRFKKDTANEKVIQLSLNPKLVHDHELREFNSISEACKAYGVTEEYSGGHPISDEIAMYNLQTEADAITYEDYKTVLKTRTDKYPKLANSWSSALCPSYDYKICEIYSGDFTIAEEFIGLGTNKQFNNDIVRIAIRQSEYELNEQIAPRFFELLKKYFEKNNLIPPKIRYVLLLGYTIALQSTFFEDDKILIGFLMVKNFTNDELMAVIMHELTHVRCCHLDKWYLSHSVGKKYSNEVQRMKEREADTVAIELTKKPLAFVTALLKSSKEINIYNNRASTFFKNKNPDQLVEHIKTHWRAWFLDEKIDFNTLEPALRERVEFLITVSVDPKLFKKIAKGVDHPTSFERICYALSQDKLQDKQKTEEQQ